MRWCSWCLNVPLHWRISGYETPLETPFKNHELLANEKKKIANQPWTGYLEFVCSIIENGWRIFLSWRNVLSLRDVFSLCFYSLLWPSATCTVIPWVSICLRVCYFGRIMFLLHVHAVIVLDRILWSRLWAEHRWLPKCSVSQRLLWRSNQRLSM